MSHKKIEESDTDLETLIELFDTALSSDNPAVKKALKNLLLISSLVNSEISDNEKFQGPLKRLFDGVQDLHRRIDVLQVELLTLKSIEHSLHLSKNHNRFFYTDKTSPSYVTTMQDTSVYISPESC